MNTSLMVQLPGTARGTLSDPPRVYPLAFYGVWADDLLIAVMRANYFIKVSWEVLSTPLTYWIVNALKRAENEDFYDTNTRFTPFSLKT